MVGEPAKGDGSQAWVKLLQGAGVLLVDCGGHHEHGVLHCDEVGDVHERLVHLGVRGDVVGGEEGEGFEGAEEDEGAAIYILLDG